jgi:HK97 family phage major capsid protein
VVDLNDEKAVRAAAQDEMHQQLLAQYRRDLEWEDSSRRARQGGQLVYRDGAEHSYFADLCRRALSGGAVDKAMDKRLLDHSRQMELHPEYRTGLNDAGGNGSSFAAPRFVQSEFDAGAHPLRATADVCRLFPLGKGYEVVVPTFSTGTTAAVPSGQNIQLAENDPGDSTVVSSVQTIAARVTVSRQLYEQASPDSTIDRIIGEDIGAAYGAQLSSSVLTGSGSSGQVTGLLNVSGVGTVSAASSVAGMVDGVVTGYQMMVSTRFRKPDVMVMHPRRWLSGFGNAIDLQGRPLMLPSTHPAALSGTPDDGVVAEWLGMRVILDVNVPTNSGSGNQDFIILGHSKDWLLYEGPLNFMANRETLAANMGVEIIGYKYAAFIPRYPSSVCLVGPFSPPTTPGS